MSNKKIISLILKLCGLLRNFKLHLFTSTPQLSFRSIQPWCNYTTTIFIYIYLPVSIAKYSLMLLDELRQCGVE